MLVAISLFQFLHLEQYLNLLNTMLVAISPFQLYCVEKFVSFQPPSQPVIGFPLPVPPPGAVLEPSEYYARGYQSAPGYLVDERRPVTEPRLPFGIGLGWFLFIIGFFLAGFPWYVAPFIPLCNRSIDHREKSGYIACTIAAVLAVIGNIVFGLTWILLTA
ncbi:60S ribosomal protein L18a-like protein isoform X8 [Solanum stenotomum]|uniref:60S ribosomal protein L18a-like protein isoform X8 n=1 Tax=Solanum stenotomum TaxID=172797 RepID=UPI0020D1C28B|nr:60S ribosomal protein L18a-like protein isoform X8 [Solanum stenotomum]